MKERYFTVTHNNRSYVVIGNENTSLDTVWNSQKCWFMKGSEVTIEDDKGNRKVFRKE
ncbi:MAG: hypothetical protein LUD77_10410 [Clostridiales bacterium]|nr:hypothetical protein [Clostridiales bacterium]